MLRALHTFPRATAALCVSLAACGDASDGTLPDAAQDTTPADDQGPAPDTSRTDAPADTRPDGGPADGSRSDALGDSTFGQDTARDASVDTGVDTSVDTGVDTSVPDAEPPDTSGPPPLAVLELNAMDLWAQALPPGGYTLSVRSGGTEVATTPGSRPAMVVLSPTGPGVYSIELSATDHRTVRAELTLDASGALRSRPIGDPGGGLAVSHGTRMLSGRSVPVHGVFLGARHLWFSASGRPARRGSGVQLLMDGEESWNAVAPVLQSARSSIHMATWWWESDFELLRDPRTHSTLSEAERRRNTVLSILEASPARKRILVGQFLGMDGVASTLTSDAALRAHGTTAGDNFEYLGQANPTRGMYVFTGPAVTFGPRVRAAVPGAAGELFDPDAPIPAELPTRTVDLTRWPTTIDLLHASWHQKFAVIDDRVAFIGGMNLRRVDWDTSQHLVFEPRRMLFGSSLANRAAVAAHNRLPDTGPRKDYMVRLEGPPVRDAQDVFQRRWQYLLDTRARYAEDASAFTTPAPGAPVAGGVQAQVTPTMPAPFSENAIAETWFNAVRQARQYLFIEDQYFRIPMLAEEMVARMTEVPTLRLVVITKPVSEWTDPGCEWTRRTHELFSTRFASRYQLLQLRAFDTQITFGFDETDAHFQDLDVHSKMLIVDDVFLSVGSANKNNRGMLYEGELNVAVVDRAWVREARRRILANLLPAGTSVSDDPAAWFAALGAAARANDVVRARWTAEGDDLSLDGRPLPDSFRPRGFLYTLTFGPPRDCLLESVGADVTFHWDPFPAHSRALAWHPWDGVPSS